MEKFEIQTLIHYPIPIHKQLAYSEFNEIRLPITEDIQNKIVSLPISPVMSLDDVKKIIHVVNKYE